MKITFQNFSDQKTESIENKGQTRQTKENGKAFIGYALSLSKDSNQDWMVEDRYSHEKKSIQDIQNRAGGMDAQVSQDYRILMSNTLSNEDYARLEQEGFPISTMEPETVVTIVDKIKAEHVRSGQHIAGYTDDLEGEVLTEAVGSESLARALVQSFVEEDIPVTEENIEQVMQAWEITQKLEQPTQGTYYYMLDNGLAPEIIDFYLAQNSGADQRGEIGKARYYAEEVKGYYSQNASLAENQQNIDIEQMDKIIKQAELAVNDETRNAAKWLLEKDLPLTPESLKHFIALEQVTFPVENQNFAQAVASAISQGKPGINANLSSRENIYSKATQVLDYYQQGEDILVEDSLFVDQDLSKLEKRGLLEEIRLKMTVEINVKLLKSGFSIDTAPMEQLIEAINQAKKQIAQDYFPKDSLAETKYENMNQVNQILGQLPTMPAQILGVFAREEISTLPLEDFHHQGLALQRKMEEAQESYETLMTEPRRDLGDNIKKAFASVDSILQDIGYESSSENQRAARILGYNRMEITPNNMERILEADEAVQRVITKMTPAATLQMIRDGVNPLTESFETLNQYFEGQELSYEETADNYSRFLYGLEHNGEITQEERESYIGIYRLLRQIEKTDGAAIGAVVNTNAELQFQNLLSAVRTGKFKHLDIRTTKDFGTLEEMEKKGEQIPEQIAKAFTKQLEKEVTEVSYSEEAERAYQEAELNMLRQAGRASTQTQDMLQRYELPINAENLMALQNILPKRDNNNKPLFTQRVTRVSDNDSMTDLWESMDHQNFSQEYDDSVNEIAEEVKENSLKATNSPIDVREQAGLYKQLTITRAMAKKEEYILPMYLGDDLTQVHVTFQRGEEKKGRVHIRVDWDASEHVDVELRLHQQTLQGIFTGNTKEEVMNLKEIADIFVEHLREGEMRNIAVEPISVVQSNQASLDYEEDIQTMDGKIEAGGPDNAQLYKIAKIFLQAMKQQKTR